MSPFTLTPMLPGIISADGTALVWPNTSGQCPTSRQPALLQGQTYAERTNQKPRYNFLFRGSALINKCNNSHILQSKKLLLMLSNFLLRGGGQGPSVSRSLERIFYILTGKKLCCSKQVGLCNSFKGFYSFYLNSF